MGYVFQSGETAHKRVHSYITETLSFQDISVHSVFTGDLCEWCLLVMQLSITWPHPCSPNNNNEYLERLTRTGPKHLHVLYKYILSKFNAYNMNAHTHSRTHTDSFCLFVPLEVFMCLVFTHMPGEELL